MTTKLLFYLILCLHETLQLCFIVLSVSLNRTFCLLIINVYLIGCRVNSGATNFEGGPKYKCCFDCMPNSLCGMLPFCQTNTTYSKYNKAQTFRICLRSCCSELHLALFAYIPITPTKRDNDLMYFILQETMSKEHAMRFPLVGSAMLLSLFLLFKFLSKDLVNAVLTAYFFVLGIVALSYVLLSGIMLLHFISKPQGVLFLSYSRVFVPSLQGNAVTFNYKVFAEALERRCDKMALSLLFLSVFFFMHYIL